MNNTNLALKEEYIDEKEETIKKEKISIGEKLLKMPYKICIRIIDICAGIVGTLLLIPITIIVWLLRTIKKENKGPIFYEQLRIGKNGKEFRLYKYRTMVMNADEKLEKYLEQNPEAKKEYRKYKKLREDPRITKVGKFLRKTSLDEFPQFINVLKGEMSLVGPRPYLHREKEDMGVFYDTIIKVKPGITGYWQVNGRNDVDFDYRVYMDTYYIENRKLTLDIKIIIKTFLKIFKREGAV